MDAEEISNDDLTYYLVDTQDKNTEENRNISTVEEEGRGEHFDVEVYEDKFIWTHSATMLFLAEYEKRKDMFRNPKIKKKKLWEEIRREMLKQGYKFIIIIYNKYK
nr:uncharacterized protein LOC111416366 [Onthophagus taurus]